MNESGFNLTQSDIRDEFSLQEHCNISTINDVNLSMINNHKDHNFEMEDGKAGKEEYMKIEQEEEQVQNVKQTNQNLNRNKNAKRNIPPVNPVNKPKKEVKIDTKNINTHTINTNTPNSKENKKSLNYFKSISNFKNSMNFPLSTPKSKPIHKPTPSYSNKTLTKTFTQKYIPVSAREPFLLYTKLNSKTSLQNSKAASDLKSLISGTQINKKLTPSSPFTSLNTLNNPLFYKTRKSYNSSLNSLNNFLTEKMEDIFDSNFLVNFKDSLFKFFEIQEESERELEIYKEEILECVQSLYQEKIGKILDVNQKYDFEIPLLKDFLDPHDPNNVNNIVYQLVVNDKEKELKEIEDEFDRKKEEGISQINSKLKERKNGIVEQASNKSEEIKKEISEELRLKLMKCFALGVPNAQGKRKEVEPPFKNKKAELSASINSSRLNNTTMPSESSKKTTISFTKKSIQFSN